MSQDITVVECKKIKAAKSGKKGLANAVLDQLHDSISKEGLLNPITVRPDPESPGYYKIVAGEHRFYVVSKMMKEEGIECRIFADMSDEEAELAQLSENACRTNAKPADRLLLLRKWQDVYRKHFPHLEGKKASGNSRWSNSTKAEAKQKAIDEEKAAEEAEAAAEFSNAQNEHYIDGDATPTEEAVVSSNGGFEPAKKETGHKTFRERVKEVTGISDATLSRELKINEGLTDEQVYVLGIVQCTKANMTKIIDVSPDLGKRAEIVSLVASGMEVDQAIEEVLGGKAEAGVTASPYSMPQGSIEVAKSPEPDKPETDEEWFLRVCGEFSGFLADTDQYKSDAILFHRLADARAKFRKSIKKILADYKDDRKGKRVGWFFLKVHGFLNASHPNDWKLCGVCGGRGTVTQGGDSAAQCPKCHGAGYEVSTEKV